MKFVLDDSSDQYNPYDILLVDTSELNAIADKIQKAKGGIPLYDDSAEYDDEEWYNFYLTCDINGVKQLWFEYGDGGVGDEIPITEQDKADAFKAVCDYFGGIEGYREYIDKWEGKYDDPVEYQKGWELIAKTGLV